MRVARTVVAKTNYYEYMSLMHTPSQDINLYMDQVLKPARWDPRGGPSTLHPSIHGGARAEVDPGHW